MKNISDIVGFHINHGHFNNVEERFDLFPYNNKKNRIALVYGHNGSGKTTIASSIREYSKGNIESGIKFYDKDNNDIVTENNDFFYVFDENYITEKVKLNQHKLGTIVLFGEQLNIEEKITDITEHIKQLSTKQDQINNEIEKIMDIKRPDSIPILKNKIEQILKDRWSISDQRLKQHKIATPVNLKNIKNIVNMAKPQKDLKEINREYQNKLELLNTTMGVGQIVFNNLPNLSKFFPQNYDKLDQMLFKTLQKPKFTRREQEIIKLFEGQMEKLTDSADYLANTDNKICELCLQPLSSDYRENVIHDLEKIKTVEFDTQIQQIRDLYLNLFDENILNNFQSLNFQKFPQLVNKVNYLNKLINAHNTLIEEKVNNPYKSFDYPYKQQFKHVFEDLQQLMYELNLSCKSYNDAIESRDQLITELQNMNNQIAFWEVKDSYEELQMKRQLKVNQEGDLSAINKNIQDLEVLKNRAKDELNDTSIAIEEINKSLQYIFYSETRMKLVPEDEGYGLQVNGKKVTPDKISLGERNVLALSYFFTELTENSKIQDLYTRPSFIVLDDPVSSFDFGNRVGIMMLIKIKMEKILLGNKDTHGLIMTHDVGVMFDLQKCFDEISKYCGSIGFTAGVRSLELRDCKIIPFKNKHNSVYSRSIYDIYNFAVGTEQSDDQEYTIGNTMRRALEAFSTFTYVQGMSDVSVNPRIIALLPEQNREYYKGCMYRLVLNIESHSMDKMQGELEAFKYSLITHEEKIRTAQDILSFIYLLNPEHVISHIKNISQNTRVETIKENISQWIKKSS